jgi:DNA polymerase-3 subunit delta'
MQADAAFEMIRFAFRNNRSAHAYLLAGAPRGGAGDVAMRVLQMLFCQAKDGPCGTCLRCRQIRERTWADVFWLQPEKKSRIISVDSMREQLLAKLTLTSFVGGWKAGVIVDADRMQASSANTLLKTLEEPPPQTLLLLLTSAPQLLLPTIASRCQRLEIEDRNLLEEPWRTQLLDVLRTPFPQAPLPAMAAAAQLVVLLEAMQEQAKDEVMEAAKEEDALDEDSDVLDARISARYREMRAGVLRAMALWYRDLMVLRAGGAPELVHFKEHLPLLTDRAKRLTISQVLANVQGMDELERQLERSLPEGPLLAYWMDRLASGVASATPAAG